MASLLVRSQLFTEPEVEELQGSFHEACIAQPLRQSLQSFCSYLVATGFISQWQYTKLRLGKWRGIVLDGYQLLDDISSESGWRVFLARRDKASALFRLAIAPSSESAGGIIYRLV